MTQSPVARAITEESWLRLAALLEEAIARPSDYGFASQGEVLNAIALERGQAANTLRLPLRARRFLERHYPDALRQGRVETGYTQVNMLERIRESDPELAERLAPDVLADRVRLSDLKAHLSQTRERSAKGSGNPTPERADARLVGARFKRLVGDYVQREPEFFCPHAPGPLEVENDPNIRGMVFDFSITSKGQTHCVIECKTFSTATTYRQMTQLLIYLASVKRFVEDAWLVVPQSGEKWLEEASRFLKINEIDDVNLAFYESDDHTERVVKKKV